VPVSVAGAVADEPDWHNLLSVVELQFGITSAN